VLVLVLDGFPAHYQPAAQARVPPLLAVFSSTSTASAEYEYEKPLGNLELINPGKLKQQYRALSSAIATESWVSIVADTYGLR
jgi:hypothetical protein